MKLFNHNKVHNFWSCVSLKFYLTFIFEKHDHKKSRQIMTSSSNFEICYFFLNHAYKKSRQNLTFMKQKKIRQKKIYRNFKAINKPIKKHLSS